MRKRILAMLLTCAMVCTGMPLITADAQELQDVTDLKADATAEIIASGTCGKNVTYTLDSVGTLKITGKGEMYDYAYNYDKGADRFITNAPWGDYDVLNLVVGKGVTNIGDCALLGCFNLKSISIAEGVTSIGELAFWECDSLTRISLPKGLKSIGVDAFSGCNKLTRISLPEGLKSIGDGAFSGCNSLTKISLPEGIKSIGDCAFSECNKLTGINIPEEVTSIGSSAFTGCENLTRVSLPEGLKCIGDMAFSGCNKLTRISIPEGLKNIGNYVFDGCRNLTIYGILDSYAHAYAIDYRIPFKSIGTVYTVGAYRYKITGADEVEFAGLKSSKTKKVKIEGTVKIGGRAFRVTAVANKALRNKKNVTSITLGANVKKIGTSAFEGCKKLKTITVKSSKLKSIGKKAFQGIKSTAKIKVPKKKLSSYKKLLKKAGIGKGVTITK